VAFDAWHEFPFWVRSMSAVSWSSIAATTTMHAWFASLDVQGAFFVNPTDYGIAERP
jgi:hypothetical protein